MESEGRLEMGAAVRSSQAVCYNVLYPLNQLSVTLLIFGDPTEAISHLLVFYARILRGLHVKIMSVLLDQPHRLELVQEFLLGRVIHCHGPVSIADV